MPPAASPRWPSIPGDFLPLLVFTKSSYSLTPPRTPDATIQSPGTSRPFNTVPPSTGSDLSEELPAFSVSTILPGFPELSLPTHVAELLPSGMRTTMGSRWTMSLSSMSRCPCAIRLRKKRSTTASASYARSWVRLLRVFPVLPAKTNAHSLNRRSRTVQRSSIRPLQI